MNVPTLNMTWTASMHLLSFHVAQWATIMCQLAGGGTDVNQIDRIKQIGGRVEVASIDGVSEIVAVSFDGMQLQDNDFNVLRQSPHIRSLSIHSRLVTSRVADHISHLPALEYLFLSSPLFDDDGLNKLKANKKLKHLIIIASRISSDGCSVLKSFSDLESLTICPSLIGDKAIEDIVTCKKLRTLNLDGSLVSNAALRGIAKLGILEVLTLNKTSIDDVGLNFLNNNKVLQIIDVSNTRITDKSMDVFVSMRALRVLSANGTALTDASLAKLGRSESLLKELRIRNTSVTTKGVEQLRKVKGIEIDCKK